MSVANGKVLGMSLNQRAKVRHLADQLRDIADALVGVLVEDAQLLVVEQEPKPAKVSPIRGINPRANGEAVELTGIVGRPSYNTPKGKQLWTAGIGVEVDGRIEWWSIVAWGKLAAIGKDIEKGEQIHIKGRVRHDTRMGDDGVVRESTQVIVSEFMSGPVAS